MTSTYSCHVCIKSREREVTKRASNLQRVAVVVSTAEEQSEWRWISSMDGPFSTSLLYLSWSLYVWYSYINCTLWSIQIYYVIRRCTNLMGSSVAAPIWLTFLGEGMVYPGSYFYDIFTKTYNIKHIIF